MPFLGKNRLIQFFPLEFLDQTHFSPSKTTTRINIAFFPCQNFPLITWINLKCVYFCVVFQIHFVRSKCIQSISFKVNGGSRKFSIKRGGVCHERFWWYNPFIFSAKQSTVYRKHLLLTNIPGNPNLLTFQDLLPPKWIVQGGFGQTTSSAIVVSSIVVSAKLTVRAMEYLYGIWLTSSYLEI